MSMRPTDLGRLNICYQNVNPCNFTRLSRISNNTLKASDQIIDLWMRSQNKNIEIQGKVSRQKVRPPKEIVFKRSNQVATAKNKPYKGKKTVALQDLESSTYDAVWKALKKSELLLATPQATPSHLPWFLNFSYRCFVSQWARTIAYELAVRYDIQVSLQNFGALSPDRQILSDK